MTLNDWRRILWSLTMSATVALFCFDGARAQRQSIVLVSDTPFLSLGIPPNNLTATGAVFEGDSLTAGAGLAKSADNTPACRTSLADTTCLDWPSQLMVMSSMKRVTSKNDFSVSGNILADLQARYTSSVHPLSPAV